MLRPPGTRGWGGAPEGDRPLPGEGTGRPVPSPVLLSLLVAAAVLLVHGRTLSYPFVVMDDLGNLVQNPHVAGGLSRESLRWALATDADAGWIPLTWISRLLDVTLFGMDARGHHAVNVLLHLSGSLLLLHALRRMTGRAWESLVAALLFAVHPQHVESVAWVTERKDVLCGLFWMLSLAAYGRYAARPGAGRYVPVLLAFAMALLSKPMAVTLPFVLLLLDVWPLRRLRPGGEEAVACGEGDGPAFPPASLRRLLLEKVPLLALSAAASLATWVSEREYGAIETLARYPLEARLTNTVVSYGAYLAKAAWPSGLAVIYPHPWPRVEWGAAALSALLLAAATAWALRGRRRRPWFLVGWLWYLGVLFPVSGLVQMGDFSRADRYAYLPMIGIYVAAAFGGAEAARRLRLTARTAAAAAAAWVAALAAVAFVQAGYWRDSETVLRRALDVAGDSPVTRNNLGIALALRGRPGEALREYREALRLRPDYVEALENLGQALAEAGRHGEAEEAFRRVARLVPGWATVHRDLGALLLQAGRVEEGVAEFREAVRLDPASSKMRLELGGALLAAGLPGEAEGEFREAVRLDPSSAQARNRLAVLAGRRGDHAGAVREFREAIRLDPRHAPSRANLAKELLEAGRPGEAEPLFREALRLDPSLAGAHNGLGVVLAGRGRRAEAEASFREAIRLAPGDEAPRRNLERLLAERGP